MCVFVIDFTQQDVRIIINKIEIAIQEATLKTNMIEPA